MAKEPVRNVVAKRPFTWPRIIDMDCGAAQRKTRAKIGFLCGTFFEGSHLSTKQIFHLSYLWAQQYGKIAQMEHETGIGHTSIVDWLNSLKDVCAEYFVQNPIEVGGEDG